MQLIKNALLFNPTSKAPSTSSILIHEGHFATPTTENTSKAEIINADNKWIVPGFIDLDCHLHSSVDNLSNLFERALKGGFTSLCILPDTKPILNDVHSIRYLISKATELNQLDIFPIASLSKNSSSAELVEMQSLAQAGTRAFLHEGQKSLRMLQMAFLYSELTGTTIFSTPLEDSLTQGGAMNYGEGSLKLGLKGIPTEAETVTIASQLELLRTHPTVKLHFSQISCERSVNLISQAKKDGLKVTAGVSAWHLAYTDQMINNWDANYKLLPPLRSERDRKALIKGLQNGSIDAIVSGHTNTAQNKNSLFAEASFGVSSIEKVFDLCHEQLVESGSMEPLELIKKLTINPSKIIYGSETLNYFKPGTSADFVIIDPKAANTKIQAVYKNGKQLYSSN